MARFGFGFGNNLLRPMKFEEGGAGPDPLTAPYITGTENNDVGFSIAYIGAENATSFTVLIYYDDAGNEPVAWPGYVPEGPSFIVRWDEIGAVPLQTLYVRIVGVRDAEESDPSNMVQVDVPSMEPPLEFDWQDFYITVGGPVLDVLYGYSDGIQFPATGSLDRNPSTNYPLSHAFWDAVNGYLFMRFYGDATADGFDYNLLIDGEAYETEQFSFDGEYTYFQLLYPGWVEGQEVEISREPKDTWHSFVVTTGAVTGTAYGFQLNPAIGAINRQPNLAHKLQSMYYNTENDQIIAKFTGDVLDDVTDGYTIRIDGIQYPILAANYIFGNTEVTFDVSEGVPWNDVGQDHSVEFQINGVAPAWQEFLLTAGNVLDVYAGFVSPGALGNPDQIGTTMPNPHSTFQTRAVVDVGAGEGYLVQVFGDCAADLNDLVLYINGVQTTRSTEAVYIEADDYTNVQYNSESTTRFVVDGQYICKIDIPGPQ